IGYYRSHVVGAHRGNGISRDGLQDNCHGHYIRLELCLPKSAAIFNSWCCSGRRYRSGKFRSCGMNTPQTVAVIGAGPAGLTAAYLLSKEDVPVVVLEADPVYVGGIARTAKYKGFHFDIGGHRFFSKSKEVEDLWTELLPNDMLERPRSSRIYYRGKFFSYPLRAGHALCNLGFLGAARCVLSYL